MNIFHDKQKIRLLYEFATFYEIGDRDIMKFRLCDEFCFAFKMLIPYQNVDLRCENRWR